MVASIFFLVLKLPTFAIVQPVLGLAGGFVRKRLRLLIVLPWCWLAAPIFLGRRLVLSFFSLVLFHGNADFRQGRRRRDFLPNRALGLTIDPVAAFQGQGGEFAIPARSGFISPPPKGPSAWAGRMTAILWLGAVAVRALIRRISLFLPPSFLLPFLSRLLSLSTSSVFSSAWRGVLAVLWLTHGGRGKQKEKIRRVAIWCFGRRTEAGAPQKFDLRGASGHAILSIRTILCPIRNGDRSCYVGGGTVFTRVYRLLRWVCELRGVFVEGTCLLGVLGGFLVFFSSFFPVLGGPASYSFFCRKKKKTSGRHSRSIKSAALVENRRLFSGGPRTVFYTLSWSAPFSFSCPLSAARRQRYDDFRGCPNADGCNFAMLAFGPPWQLQAGNFQS